MMQSRMAEIGARQYIEALADPRGWQPEPGMVIRPFHMSMPGMPDRFHVYCERHPEFGFCGDDAEARNAALEHGREHVRESVGTTDG